jgi:hypothetical protein
MPAIEYFNCCEEELKTAKLGKILQLLKNIKKSYLSGRIFEWAP